MIPMQSLLRSTFEQHGSRLALQGRTWAMRYAELARASDDLARVLLAHGVRAGDTVPLFVARSALLVLAEVALVRLGAAYAPIDLASPSARQRAMLDAIAPALIVTDGAATPVSTARVLDIAAWWRERTMHASAASAAPQLWAEPGAGGVAYVMFTSGSTGVPKGVQVPYGGIVRLVHATHYAHFRPEQRWGFLSSPAFDLSTLEVWGALLNGGCCVVQEEALPSLDVLGEFLAGQRISDTWLTSALFNAMVEDQLAALGGLQQLLVGGERVSPQHARRMLQAHPNVRLINGYGPTENTTFTLCHTITLADTEASAGVPIGTALSGTTVRVAPTDPTRPSEGELWTGGAGVALGYLGDAELTQRKFVWREGTRWYRTGDLVRERADGVFEFLGRIDRQIKLRGHRIELEEVELALTRCPGVGNAAVLVVGEEAAQRRIVAVYSGLEADAPAAEEVAAQLRLSLPEPSVPSEFVRMAQLPANLNGKVDREALQAMFADVRDAPTATATLGERLQHIIAAHASHTALEGDAQSLSYAELDRLSATLAARLVELGVRSGDPLPLFLPRSTFLIVAMIAAVRIGAVYVPIDMASPPARLARIVAALQAKVALTDGALAIDGAASFTCVDRAELASLPRPAQALPWATIPPDAPLYIMFTSGSTGAPKGVVVPARGLLALVVDALWASFPSDARWLLVTSPAFDISNVEIWGALLNGACCVVQEGELPSLDELAALLVQRRITHAQMSTALFNAMVDTQLPSFARLAQFITGGERASPPHMRALLLAHPSIRLINGYGPTETTIYSLTHTVALADTHAGAGVPIGRAVRGTQLRIEPAASDDGGELLVAGAGVALGYLNDAAQTALKFVERNGQRWYCTGDIVQQRADGVFEFRGRADRQVKLQGQRIEIDEVELALAACSGVGEVAVFVRGDDAAHRHLAACYSGLAGPPPDAEAVMAQLAARLPAAALPKEVRAVERLPRNSNGKVDRAALAQLLDDAPAHPAGDAADGQACGEIETALAAIWHELLPGATVRRDSHFLRIGGTSLLALHVAAIVHRRMQRILSPIEVLRHPVLAEQARLIAASATIADDAAPRHHAGQSSVALTRGQQSLLAASRLDPSGCAYLVHTALLLQDTPDWAAWRAAFEQLAQRHPALRLSAHHDGERGHASLAGDLASGWWQEHPASSAAPRDLDWPDALLAVVNRPLDTRLHDSMRVDAWPLRAGGALVVWTVHHHVIDEAAIATALTELDALLQGRELAPVYGSPFAFASLESAWTDPPAATDALAAQLAETLAGCTPPLERAPAVGSERRFALPPALQQRLRQRCAALGCTPFTLLLGAYGRALQEVFGPRFRFVSTPFSRRAEPELIEPIGYLLDVRLIEAGTRPGETSAAALARVHAAVLQAQRPAFQASDALMQAVAARDLQAAQCLTPFGFSWRLDPAGALRMAGRSAQLLRVPQAGARYSLALHAAQLEQGVAYSIEAVGSAHRGGQVAAVARAFEAHLAALCAASDELALPRSPAPDDAAMPTTHPALRPAWSRWLGVPESGVHPSSHFLRSGGSSLTAMRMAAELRRDHGLALDVGTFLADASFARLAAQTSLSAPPRPADCVLLGAADYTRVVLLVPGDGGQVASLYALADELRARLPARTAVAVVDLDAVLRSAPADDPLWHVTKRLQQIILDYGSARVASLVGFSLGALLLLRAVKALPVGIEVPVWMLDAYAPRYARKGFWRRLERRLAWALLGGQPIAAADAHAQSRHAHEALPVRATVAQWQRLFEQLDRSEFAAPNARVRLIQARQSVGRIGLLWRRAHNGFVPGQYASWSVHGIEGDHLDVPRRHAATTAALLVAAVGD